MALRAPRAIFRPAARRLWLSTRVRRARLPNASHSAASRPTTTPAWRAGLAPPPTRQIQCRRSVPSARTRAPHLHRVHPVWPVTATRWGVRPQRAARAVRASIVRTRCRQARSKWCASRATTAPPPRPQGRSTHAPSERIRWVTPRTPPHCRARRARLETASRQQARVPRQTNARRGTTATTSRAAGFSTSARWAFGAARLQRLRAHAARATAWAAGRQTAPPRRAPRASIARSMTTPRRRRPARRATSAAPSPSRLRRRARPSRARRSPSAAGCQTPSAPSASAPTSRAWASRRTRPLRASSQRAPRTR
jgi:hypothetical protein